MQTETMIRTNIGNLIFEIPTKIYPGSLFDLIKCPHCENFIDGYLYLGPNNKYIYKINCNNCLFSEVG